MANEIQNFKFPEVRVAPSRFRHALSKHRITISKACTNCGLCIDLCPYHVYEKGMKHPKVSSERTFVLVSHAAAMTSSA